MEISDTDRLVVDEFMRSLAAEPLDQATQLDPAVLWFKAQLLRRWDMERRVTRAIDISETVQPILALVGCIVLAVWLFRAGVSPLAYVSIAAGIAFAALFLSASVALGFRSTVGD